MKMPICRVCLRGGNSTTLNMHNIEKTKVLGLYEKITCTKFDIDERLPHTICIICLWQLEKYRNFSNIVLQSQKILHELLDCGEQITQSSVAKIVVKPAMQLSISPLKITSCYNKESFDDNTFNVNVKQETLEVKLEPRDSSPDIDHYAMTNVEMLPTEKTKVSRRLQKTKEIDMKKYHCKYCNTKFHSEKMYSMHYRNHLALKHKHCENCSIPDDMSRRNQNRTTRHFCEICDKCFTAKKSLLSHMNTHNNERPYVCEICGLSFTYPSNMVRHKKVVHNGTENLKPFSCKMCPKTFKFEPFLIRHQKVHTDKKKRYGCNYCEWKFSYKHNLAKHMRVHTGERPYACDFCGKTFPVKGSLTVHLRIHTRTTPYQCAECNVSFTQKAHLTTHIKIIHQGEKPFSCELCHKLFTMRSNLKKHMKRHALKDALEVHVSI